MIQSMAGVDVSHQPGDILDVEDRIGLAWIAADICVAAPPPPPPAKPPAGDSAIPPTSQPSEAEIVAQKAAAEAGKPGKAAAKGKK
jgi:hypothetical protein